VPLQFTGSGFLPWEALAVTIQGQAGQPEAGLASIIADRAGQFGLHWIPPAVQLDTYTVKPGQDFGFVGSGFLPNETVAVRLGSPMGRRLAPVHATARRGLCSW
jgi:hypothetical protein